MVQAYELRCYLGSWIASSFRDMGRVIVQEGRLINGSGIQIPRLFRDMDCIFVQEYGLRRSGRWLD